MPRLQALRFPFGGADGGSDVVVVVLSILLRLLARGGMDGHVS